MDTDKVVENKKKLERQIAQLLHDFEKENKVAVSSIQISWHFSSLTLHLVPGAISYEVKAEVVL